MISLFSTEQIRDVDSFAIDELGIPGEILMENASLEIFRIADEKFSSLKKIFKTVGFVCGKGNNGGDGYAAARHFANYGYDIIVIQIGHEHEMSKDCRQNYDILYNLSEYNPKIKINEFNTIKSLNELKKCDAVFDAMLGSGSHGELKEPYNDIVKYLNKLNTFRVAVDIPTGLDADKGHGSLVFNADLTITLAEFKKGLFFGDGHTYSGKIVKGRIGIDPDYFSHIDTNFYLIEPDDAFEFLPEKKVNAHKYSAGKVLTIAGSGEYPGAAVMTSSAAFKIGAGASVLSFPKAALKYVSKKNREVVVDTYKTGNKEFLTSQNVKELTPRLQWADAAAIGPGLGREVETQKAIIRIIKERKNSNLIIDADGLYPFNKGEYKKHNLSGFILTPHHAEFSALLGISNEELRKDLSGFGLDFVKETGTYLVLKGAPTIIFTPDADVFVNSAGNPGMAKFGTGDVLTGVIAGVLSQQQDKRKAIISAVYIHSLTGDLISRKYTRYGFTATDIIKNIPFTIKFLRDSFV